jgi:hypothetical protein
MLPGFSCVFPYLPKKISRFTAENTKRPREKFFNHKDTKDTEEREEEKKRRREEEKEKEDNKA